jgi:serine protease SohB
MTQVLMELGLFAAKMFIVLVFIVVVLLVFFALIAKAKQKSKGQLKIKNINKEYHEAKEAVLAETLDKHEFKKFLKQEKKAQDKKPQKAPKHIYVLNFNGDIKASSVCSLKEEITTVLNVASPTDEVVVRLESAGGMVHAYGLAAAELLRIKAKKIALTITIDKVAASGGYLMACTANKILAAPFAIVGSIGVIVQLPNFHRLLKDKDIDFEQHTAGEYKRTITVFGENTDEGRKKLQEEIDHIHDQFKDLIVKNRPHIDIKKVATGEYWLGERALQLNLVDEIITSDDYLLQQSAKAKIFEISYELKKPFLAKLSATSSLLMEKVWGKVLR